MEIQNNKKQLILFVCYFCIEEIDKISFASKMMKQMM